MADYAKVSSDDGLRVTVNELVKDPLVIPKRVEEDVKAQFWSQRVLRKGGTAESGVIKFYMSESPYADDDPEELQEYSEIPLTQSKRGLPYTAFTKRYGRGLRISEQTVRRNNQDELAKDMAKLRNSWARFDENLMVSALLAGLGTYTGHDWNVTTTATADLSQSVFGDLARASFNITNADADSNNGSGRAKLRFKPNTLILNTQMAARLLLNRDVINQLAVGNVANRNPLINGDAGGSSAVNALGQAFGLSVETSDLLDPDKAILVESGTVGFWADEKPLYFSPLEFKASTRSYYTYGDRSWGVALDQPKAGLVITGINGGNHTMQNF